MKNTGGVQRWSGNSANEIPFESRTDVQVKRMGRAFHWVKIKHQGIIGKKIRAFSRVEVLMFAPPHQLQGQSGHLISALLLLPCCKHPKCQSWCPPSSPPWSKAEVFSDIPSARQQELSALSLICHTQCSFSMRKWIPDCWRKLCSLALLPVTRWVCSKLPEAAFVFHISDWSPAMSTWAGLPKAIKLGRQWTNFPQKPSLLSLSRTSFQSLAGASKAVNMESVTVLQHLCLQLL